MKRTSTYLLNIAYFNKSCIIIKMIELIHAETGELLGIEYTQEERETAVAAVCLYLQHLLTGRITDDVQLIIDGQEVSETVMRSLSDGLDIINVETHNVLKTLYLPHVARLHEGLRGNKYEEFCAAIAVKPFELFLHGMNARRMIDESDIEPRIIG